MSDDQPRDPLGLGLGTYHFQHDIPPLDDPRGDALMPEWDALLIHEDDELEPSDADGCQGGEE